MRDAGLLRRFLTNAHSSRRERAPKPDEQYVYKAFISYSHSADSKLAPSLQKGLHRFAKPWYRLRAMRVFRDETTLSTSPELWPSIESALGQSEYFLFLASPEAAQSFWVRKEFEYWVRHRSKDRMLIILTGGELLWDRDAQDFDWATTAAVPRGIDHGFQDEPLYLDLRWAKTADDLSLRNLSFRSAIADLASTLLDRPKDELVGEDVRQHRRTRQVAWSAAAALFVLTVVSVVAAVLAVQNQRIAEERGAIALSRQLAAQAVSLAGSERGDLSLLLSLVALEVRATVDARNGLLAALTRDPYRLFHLHGHMGEVNSLAFSADGRELLALGCEGIDTLGLCKDFGVRRWDAASGEPKGQVILPGANGWTGLSRGGDGESIVARDSRAHEWNVATGRPLERTSSPGLMSPRGDVLAEMIRDRVVLRSAGSNQQLRTPFGDAGEAIRTVAFHPSAPLVAVGGSKGEVRIWDTGELLQGSREPRRVLASHRAAVIDLDFSPNGRYLVTASWDDTVLLWNLEAATAARRLAEGVKFASTTFSPDGRRLVIATSIGERGGELQVWDAESWRLIDTLAGKGPVAIDPNGHLLAAAGADGSVIVRDLERDRPLGRPLEDPGNLTSLVFADGGRLLVGGGHEGAIRIWDVGSGRLDRAPVPTGQGAVNSLAAHPHHRLLASGGEDGSILVWDLESPEAAGPRRLAGHDSPVSALDFSADGRQLVSGGFDKTLRFWETATGQPLGRPPVDTGQDVYVARFDSSAARVATATEDGSVLIWQLTDEGATGTVVGTHLLQSDGMTGLAFGPRDRFLVSSSLEQTQFWGLEPGEPRVRAPIDGSFAVLSPDGERAALVTDSDEIHLVDVGTWRAFDAAVGRPRALVYAMAFSPDGRQLASAAEGDAVLWDLDLASWRRRACAIARRNLTPDEWRAYLDNRPYSKTCPEAADPPAIPLDAERALGLAVRSAKLGESAKVGQLFAEAAARCRGESAELANRVCWFGAPRGAFAEVMVACERAVLLDPHNVSYRDSRGIARAQAKDITGALEDFRVYVANRERSAKLVARRERRQAWIEALEAGRDPFDSMELHRVRSEGALR